MHVGAYLWSPGFILYDLYIITISKDAINRGKRPSMKGKAPFISQALFPQFIASIVTLLFLKNKNLNYPGETMISPPLYSVPGTKPALVLKKLYTTLYQIKLTSSISFKDIKRINVYLLFLVFILCLKIKQFILLIYSIIDIFLK